MYSPEELKRLLVDIEDVGMRRCNRSNVDSVVLTDAEVAGPDGARCWSRVLAS